ncbi:MULTISPECIES: type II toxin-antitoxin system HipA family toxin [Bradyrhizobium]|uniref:Type II toxin-antitoxin system HipA family toxin n=3 Tax=Bradyrhizobium TaxID=374 RepID=A0A973WVT1_9BRAD|nr:MULTISPECIES: type II toxin-antitoxin system HipA family toxin [Bradyrhizobium]UFX44157.1 type II toxin-antitoxin system HipA family toxin [Bradyrhizobium sp. 41S5]UGA44456.1 type II toxin-antitoxin system HipA family toxin [Bradyrhizobium quebecense]UGY00669.1 type II toxin-antitoxin system HipA family toxin [Bradyrhizobium quebecense]UPT88820.1 type II toxin-antitoxin system HipA family toxin [Bradyrhizobium barranii subsp. apii]UPT96035.1 type II toxin-antitoxin system HipA family toxin 
MTSELVALLDGREVGRVHNDARGRLTFVYDSDWRQTRGAYPISLSMPLAAEEHGPAAVQAFLWGLLPDNERVLDRWAKKFQVSARNVFALISHVGEDCAGAIQFVTRDRLEELRSGTNDKVEWLDETAVAKRLQALREDHAAWRLPRDTGQFSLAGAQPKTALLLQKARWGIPSGGIPTTHILKPPTGHFDGHAENEHICLNLARNLGLPVAGTKVVRFEKEIAIVVERYDRQFSGNDVIRVHQEDACQARGIMPTKKYQSEGGPSAADIIELLRTYSTDSVDDLDTFIDALGLNWLIGGTDAHAKNYSLLLASGPTVRLAPLYDVASILPYDDVDLQKMKLAMKVGGEYRLAQIGAREWQKFARETRFDAEKVIAGLNSLAELLPDNVSDVCAAAQAEGLDNVIIERLSAKLIERAKECQRLLKR